MSRIRLSSDDKLAMNAFVDDRLLSSPKGTRRSDLQTTWIHTNKPAAAQRQLISVEYDGVSHLIWNDKGYSKHTVRTIFTSFCCLGANECSASINLIQSAEKGTVLALLMNQTHTGHKIRDLTQYNEESGRSYALEIFVDCCKTLRLAGFDVKTEIAKGVEKGFDGQLFDSNRTETQNDDVEVAALLFQHYVYLLHGVFGKFEDKHGTSRAYSHLNVGASRSMTCDQLLEFLRYLGMSSVDSEVRAQNERSSAIRVLNFVKACGGYEFDSIQLFSGLSAELATSIEALIIEQFAKNSEGRSQVLNDKYDKCDEAYLFDNDESNMEVGAALLVYGLMSGSFDKIDLKPRMHGGKVDEIKLELYNSFQRSTEMEAENKMLKARLEENEEKRQELESICEAAFDILDASGIVHSLQTLRIEQQKYDGFNMDYDSDLNMDYYSDLNMAYYSDLNMDEGF
jgi:hypothetical protein